MNEHGTQESSLPFYELPVLCWVTSLEKQAPAPCLEERDGIASPSSIGVRKTTLKTLRLQTLMRRDKLKSIFRMLMLM